MKESHGWKLIFEEAAAEPDPPHHAPSDTIKVDDPDKYFQPPQRKHGEPLTKRERFAMEFAKSLIYRGSPSYDVSVMIGAVELADDLIAELTKGRK